MLINAKTVFTAGLLAASGGLASMADAALPYSVTSRNFFGTMTFPRSVQTIAYPGEDSAFVIVQQGGKLVTVRRVASAWAKTDSAVIAVLGGTSSGNEQGLLGFTFHPNFRQNRKYYTYAVISGAGNGFNQIAERTTDSTLRPHTNDAQRIILRMVDPYSNHNGGTIKFGPDGYLYFASGDAGSGGDPQGRAQNLDSLFGKILRLDVSGSDAYPADTTKNYNIPSDNPFVGQGGRPEIWAYGLRNPFRWTFHPTNGEMWVGDVGQDYREEISHVTKGANMGWKIREANTCFNPAAGQGGNPLTSCNTTGMTPAVITIERDKGQSITGGEFFIGNPSSAFHGAYFFADYNTDSLWAARIVNDSAVERIRLGNLNAVASFNLDLQGRVLAVSVENSIVYVLESPDMLPAPVSVRPMRRPGIKAITVADLLRHPENYTIKSLDGRLIRAGQGGLSGAALVQKKGSQEPPELLPLVW